MFSAVYNRSYLAWSPYHLAPRAWSPDHLATSHLGPPLVQQQSRFGLVSSCHGAFVCMSMYSSMPNGNNLTNSGATGFDSGILLCIHLLRVHLLIWELSCLI